MSAADESITSPAKRGQRDYVTTVVVQLFACLVALWSLSQAWVLASSPSGFGQQAITVSGSSLYPVSVAGAWLGLALIVGVIATSGGFRRAIGIAICVAAIAVIVGPISFFFASEAELATASARVAATDAARTSSWVMTGACGLVIFATGLVVWSRARSWRSLSSRQSGSRPAVTPWEALDRGDDPTA